MPCNPQVRVLTMNEFPYGSDPLRPHSFLGLYNAPSRRWLVSYWAGFSIVAGYHSFIFLGLENLAIGKAYLRGVGLNVNFGARRLGRTPRQEQVIERTENIINNYDAARDYLDLNAATDSASNLFRAMMNETIPTLVTARTPFSLLDVEQAWGMVEGFNADIYVAGAQVYWLTMHNEPRFLNSDRKYMERQRVSNLDDGSIGAGVGNLYGNFSIAEYYDLYSAFGTSHDPNERPYRRIPNVHPYISELPPARSSGAVPQAALQRLPRSETAG